MKFADAADLHITPHASMALEYADSDDADRDAYVFSFFARHSQLIAEVEDAHCGDEAPSRIRVSFVRFVTPRNGVKRRVLYSIGWLA